MNVNCEVTKRAFYGGKVREPGEKIVFEKKKKKDPLPPWLKEDGAQKSKPQSKKTDTPPVDPLSQAQSGEQMTAAEIAKQQAAQKQALLDIENGTTKNTEDGDNDSTTDGSSTSDTE